MKAYKAQYYSLVLWRWEDIPNSVTYYRTKAEGLALEWHNNTGTKTRIVEI